jgi:hypothetical protein
MAGPVMCWTRADARTFAMDLTPDGVDWVEVKRVDRSPGEIWRVDSRLGGQHYKVADAFPTMEAAQGCALLLALRLLPACRSALEAQLDVLPGAWWWKIMPSDDAAAEPRSVFSSRVQDSPEAAERSGRAAGAGWWLFVHGPGSVRALGLQPR